MAKEDSGKQSGNIFDRIFKENAQFIFIPLIEMELGIEIRSYQPLQEKITKTLEREVDFLYKIVTKEKEELLLHLEFQTNNDVDMLFRMQEYHALLQRKYKLPIKHVVIYLGKTKVNMRSKLKPKEIFNGFDIISLRKINTQYLLAQQVPEVVMMALLGKYPKEHIEQILRLITSRLRQLASSEQEQERYLRQLLIISRLRNLQLETEKIIKDMPIHYDVNKDHLFLRGLAKGEAIGIEKGEAIGIEKGEAIGIEKGKAKGVIALYKLGLSSEKIAEEMELLIDTVISILEKHRND